MAATRPERPALDPAALDANTMSDRALQRELFDLYFAQAPKFLDGLRAALAEDDRRRWRESAHSLKGTARTLGLLRFADLCAAAEDAAPEAQRADRICAACAEAQAAAYAYLASQMKEAV